MSKAHLFHSADGLVPKALRGLIAYNPDLALDVANRVVYDTSHDSSMVSVISGGGSGHEPAWSGYVGTNMLAASAAGDIFASPSTKQILAAIEATRSDKGAILVVTNYTGDCLHFGLAAEKAIAAGHKCKMIICGDDVSVGRSGGSLVGRRGLAGQIGVLKVMGAASGAGASLDQVYNLGVAFSRQISSIAATLDHCHVPGRTEHGALANDELEIGTGPHNEPGYRKLQPAPSAEELVTMILKYCLDETDANRAYVRFSPGDETALLVSNFGGMSQLELSALVDEILEQLARDWKIEPVRVYAGPLETSLNAPAFSVSVVNLTEVAKDPECPYSLCEIKDFLDTRTNTYWESLSGSQTRRRPRSDQFVHAKGTAPKDTAVEERPGLDIVTDPGQLEKGLRAACKELIDAEPDLTRWDTVMGDGDCGETLKTGALALLSAVDSKNLAGSGSSILVLRELEHIVEDKMGGTLGGILGIFFVALRTAVENAVAADKGDKQQDPTKIWASALTTALGHLGHYTPAKIGDRTVMDTLLPFAQGMAKANSFEAGVKAAEQGAESTKTLKPRLGRATYVAAGKENGSQALPPDPGAWGAMVAIRGLYTGLGGSA